MTDDAETEADMLKWAHAIARKNGWILNPDEDHLNIVIGGWSGTRKSSGGPTAPAGCGAATKSAIAPSNARVSITKTKLQRTGTATVSSITKNHRFPLFT